MFVGSATGKDGIGGASLHRLDIHCRKAQDLTCSTCGDPFQEKKLLEACLEVIQTGAVCWYAGYGSCRNYLLHF
jgi:phosphoribosylformylglycinamidine synthase